MAANEFDASTKPVLPAFYPLRLRHCESSGEGGLRLSNSTIVRIADHLLETNRHLLRFEVGLGDSETCHAVAEALRARGCRVEQDPFKYHLTLTVPEALSKSA